jgi:hypothetical protein
MLGKVRRPKSGSGIEEDEDKNEEEEDRGCPAHLLIRLSEVRNQKEGQGENGFITTASEFELGLPLAANVKRGLRLFSALVSRL